MILAFLGGVGVVLAVFAHSAWYRYRNVSRRPGRSRLGRLRYVIVTMLHPYLVRDLVIGGVAGVVLWHGFNDILRMLVDALGWVSW